MKVTLIASTLANINAMKDLGMDWDGDSLSIDTVAEFAGRACYQSFQKPNPATAKNRDYLANIIEQGHFSVLEHGSATFYIEGVSRSLTHELVRHRHLSYSQLSQRYVNIEDAEIVIPPALDEILGEFADPVKYLGSDGLESPTVEELLHGFQHDSAFVYKALVETLEAKGLSRKQAREAARCVSPNMIETKIVVTGNLRAWRDFLQKRHSVHADREIQALAKTILNILRGIAPGAVQDIPDEPYQ